MMFSQRKRSDIDIRDAFFDELHHIASKDENVIFLTADMGAFSLERFKKDLPGQYLNVGAAEQDMISIAAGLALGGKNVFTYGIASFVTMRCYEQIKIDISGMCLPVTIVGVGAGVAYGSDGYTHHAVQDISIMRALPGMTIFNPSDAVMAAAVAEISYKSQSPVYVRIDKGKPPLIYEEGNNFSDGVSLLKKGRDLLIVTSGIMVHQAFKLAEVLAEHSIDAGVVDLYRIKPVNEDLLLSYIEGINKLITLEEHSIIGGIGSVVCEILSDKGKFLSLKRFALADRNPERYGDRDWMQVHYGLNIKDISNTIINWCKESKSIRTHPFSDDELYFDLTIEDFARSFGTTVDDIPDDCLELISKYDFRYRKLNRDEHDRILLDLMTRVDSGNLKFSGRGRKGDWENGWRENLRNFVEKDYDLNELVPKYIRYGQPVRFNMEYIMPLDEKFELNFFKVYRLWLFKNFLNGVDSIYEFGCGTGHNLVELSKLYPGKKIYGLDWTIASIELIDKIRKIYGYNITGYLFDMFSPDENLDIPGNSAIITIGSLEQLGSDYEAFLQFVMKKSPAICLHTEPICELYDERNLIDCLFIKYHKNRGYLYNYLTRLRDLESKGLVEIIKIHRTSLGSMVQEGYSIIIWRPQKKLQMY